MHLDGDQCHHLTTVNFAKLGTGYGGQLIEVSDPLGLKAAQGLFCGIWIGQRLCALCGPDDLPWGIATNVASLQASARWVG